MSIGSIAENRILTEDVLGLELGPSELAPENVVAGRPGVSSRVLSEALGAEVGVWQLTAGTVTDTEVDEVFIVLAGDATVAFADGSEIDLKPGVAVRLRAGDRTVWTVRETLRKIYVV
ncbi:cupin domain-containing protein [Actinoplanes sichuanensis]|uniref:Cupin domain-containing protein n=1 Tax=Actinoplanes sichuanensis TaxID=512349 RepID=A0ABW4A496_9ACTN|nr:cupin domain-containing protein [Actinoplanes sichuanensis]BEL05632.1 cupin domain-containing protein [Actinoplanes sichuanensis]